MKKTFTAFIVALGLIGIFIFSLPYHSDAKNPKSQVQAEKLQTNWLENLNDAIKISQETGKPILLYFTGSDWCGYCKKLDEEVFNQEPFIKYANRNLVLLKVDFPIGIKQPEELIKQNQKLQKIFQVIGYPTVILVKADKKNVVRIANLPTNNISSQAYVDYIKLLLKNYEEKSKK